MKFPNFLVNYLLTPSSLDLRSSTASSLSTLGRNQIGWVLISLSSEVISTISLSPSPAETTSFEREPI